MTPIALGVLLHYYIDINDPTIVIDNSPIWESTRKYLIDNGLIFTSDKYGATYDITERGRCFIAYICNDLYLPLCKWTMEF